MLDKLTRLCLLAGFVLIGLLIISCWLLGLFFVVFGVTTIVEYAIGIEPGQAGWLGLLIGVLYLLGTLRYFMHLHRKSNQLDRDTDALLEEDAQ